MGALTPHAARLDDTVTDPVFVGGQSLSEDDLKPFTEWMEGVLPGSAPDVVNRATFTDEAGVPNSAYLLYWRALRTMNWAKQKAVSGWWKSQDRLAGTLGIWR